MTEFNSKIKQNSRILKIFLFSICALFACAINSHAQSLVKGTVTDGTGEPLPGVSIVVKGTTNGTVTDMDGKYSIQAAAKDILSFSYIGMTNQDIKVAGRTVINIVMKDDVAALDEVIVVGYGVQKKQSLTGAVSAMKGDELLKAPSTNVTQMLAGKLAGISSVQESGEPGLDNASLRIRGSVYDAVYIVGGEESRKGLSDELLPQVMKQLIDFANAEDDLNELHKAAILHFAFAYYHPYFDGNGRTARLLHLWYLARHGYPAALFTPFSRYIDESKAAYYKAYERVEKNAMLTGYTDVTPFLSYFCKEVYNRLQADTAPAHTDFKVYQQALVEGRITEKERLLWEYVLSAYGTSEFTTKQLEKDFRNAAYATIRTFVMKFHDMDLLAARNAGNRVFYKVK